MNFEDHANGFELFVDVGHQRPQLTQFDRRAYAGHHVFALSVDQQVAVIYAFPRARIARETNTGSAIVAHVAENHLADVDGCTRKPRDVLDVPVGDRFVCHPASKHRVDGPL